MAADGGWQSIFSSFALALKLRTYISNISNSSDRVGSLIIQQLQWCNLYTVNVCPNFHSRPSLPWVFQLPLLTCVPEKFYVFYVFKQTAQLAVCIINKLRLTYFSHRFCVEGKKIRTQKKNQLPFCTIHMYARNLGSAGDGGGGWHLQNAGRSCRQRRLENSFTNFLPHARAFVCGCAIFKLSVSKYVYIQHSVNVLVDGNKVFGPGSRMRRKRGAIRIRVGQFFVCACVCGGWWWKSCAVYNPKKIIFISTLFYSNNSRSLRDWCATHTKDQKLGSNL